MAPTRRQLIASTGTVISGGLVATLFTTNSNAQTDVQLNGLSVQSASTTADRIEDVLLSVDASYTYDAGVNPTRVILRLEAKTNNSWMQIDATEPDTVSQSQSETIQLKGSLLKLESLDADKLVPTERGSTNSMSIDVRLTLEIQHDGDSIGTANSEDSTSINITREEIQIGMSVGGDGSIIISTETPTG